MWCLRPTSTVSGPTGPVIQVRSVQTQQHRLGRQGHGVGAGVQQGHPLSAREGRDQIFKPLDLCGERDKCGIDFGELLVVDVSLLLQGLGFRKEMRKIVQPLALPTVQLARMNLMFSGDLRDRFFFFEHFQNRLRFECSGMLGLLLRRDVSSVSLEAPQICLAFRDHYSS